MFQSIWDDVKREFQHGNMVTRLIVVNIAVWVFINIAKLVLQIPLSNANLYNDFLRFFSMTSDWHFILRHPWTPFTSIFLHEGFMHLLGNMLTFYWFGRVVGDLLGNHRILPLYFMGGLFGSAVYFTLSQFNIMGLSVNTIPVLGASGAVMCIMACAAFIAPNYIFNVLLIGPVKLKYIALVLLFLDLISIADRSNTGGHMAHLGGAAFGALFATQLQKGVDLTKVFENIVRFFNNLFKPRPRPNLTYNRNEKAYAETRRRQQKQAAKSGQKASDTEGSPVPDEQAQLDAILDKIKQKGYDSLSKDEKDFLFKASQK